MASGLGMHSWKSGKGLLDCSSLNSGRVRLNHSHAHYFLLSKSSNLYRVSPPKKTTFKDYMAYAPVKEYKEQFERAWPPSPHTLQRHLSWPVALHLDYSGRGCVGLVFMSRCMRPEGPWQWLATALTDSSHFSHTLYYMTGSCPHPLWVTPEQPLLLLPDFWKGVWRNNQQTEE